MIFIEMDLRKPAFSAKLLSRFGDDRASAVTYSCYAALAAVIQAASRLDAPAARQELHAALLETEKLSLVDHTLAVQGRAAQFPLIYKTIQDGAIVPLGSDAGSAD